MKTMLTSLAVCLLAICGTIGIWGHTSTAIAFDCGCTNDDEVNAQNLCFNGWDSAISDQIALTNDLIFFTSDPNQKAVFVAYALLVNNVPTDQMNPVQSRFYSDVNTMSTAMQTVYSLQTTGDTQANNGATWKAQADIAFNNDGSCNNIVSLYNDGLISYQLASTAYSNADDCLTLVAAPAYYDAVSLLDSI